MQLIRTIVQCCILRSHLCGHCPAMGSFRQPGCGLHLSQHSGLTWSCLYMEGVIFLGEHIHSRSTLWMSPPAPVTSLLAAGFLWKSDEAINLLADHIPVS